jgi:hypothetical protein
MYARAPACCADNPRNWSQPESLGSPVLATTALVADEQGHLHAAFASQETQGIVYRRSDDGGNTWPVLVDLPGGLRLSDEYAVYPRLAVDGRGRVHAVWTVEPWPGRAVMYARSDDGGGTWSEPEMIDLSTREEYEEGYGPLLIDVEAYGEDEIHLIWEGAPTIERTHIWSSDGGGTWSDMRPLFPEVSRVGRAGWNDMAVDSAGMLHAVSVRAVGPPLHAMWNGILWSSTDEIVTTGPATSGTEYLRMAISRGNTLHVVWTRKVIGEVFTVWYARGQAPVPELPGKPLPTLWPILTPTPILATPTFEALTLLPTRTADFETGTTSKSSQLVNSPASAVVAGIIPTVLIIVAVVVGLKIRRILS